MRPGMFIQSGLRGFPDRESSLKHLKKILPFSVVIFKSDFSNEEDLKELIKQINHIYRDEGVQPPVLAVDQEGGNVVRMPWLDYNPSNFFLGISNNIEFTSLVGKITGSQLHKLGIKWNLAPVLDVLNSYNQVILERSFSEDVEKVANHGAAYISGLQEAGVAATAKHFPGHGGVLGDSHLMLPRDFRGKDSLLNDAFPFVKSIEAGVKSIMLSHVLYESLDEVYPASMSPAIQKMLRDQMGYNGVIVTDSVDMKAVSNNYILKEVVNQSVGSGTDLVECADLVSSIEMADYIKSLDSTILREKSERLTNLLPTTELSYVPPTEVLSSFALLDNRVIRKHSIDPNRQFAIVFLDNPSESRVSEPNSPFNTVTKKLQELRFQFTTPSLEDMSSDSSNQIIFIGRNEHLKERHSRFSEICKGKDCIFISTSISKDVGVIDQNIGYIAAYSTKKENLLGGIYRALGFF